MTKKNPHAVALGRKGGSVTSKAKTEAARENGKKGGRPPYAVVRPFGSGWAVVEVATDHVIAFFRSKPMALDALAEITSPAR